MKFFLILTTILKQLVAMHRKSIDWEMYTWNVHSLTSIKSELTTLLSLFLKNPAQVTHLIVLFLLQAVTWEKARHAHYFLYALLHYCLFRDLYKLKIAFIKLKIFLNRALMVSELFFIHKSITSRSIVCVLMRTM